MTELPGTRFAWRAEADAVVITRRPPPLARWLFLAALAAYLLGAGAWLLTHGAELSGRRREVLLVVLGFGLLSFLAVAMAWLRGYARRVVVRASTVEVHARLGGPQRLAAEGAAVKLSIEDFEDRTAVRIELRLQGAPPRPIAYTRDGAPEPYRPLAAALRSVLSR